MNDTLSLFGQTTVYKYISPAVCNMLSEISPDNGMSQKSSAHFSSPFSVISISQNLTKGSFQWTSAWHFEVMIWVKKCKKKLKSEYQFHSNFIFIEKMK